ncbi:Hypothetical predicted protein [Paramuricea clavata]|uniref:Uncharacterized protein n=1 Tax=Paramuricea clavata TaxID=317549 RepID=A0A6S7HHF5_PARCT|nr:Hypothetical predicted protein [Paramuricea clavata]
MKIYADIAAKAKPHIFCVGNTVLVRQKRQNKLFSPYNKHPYTITQIKGSMITARNAAGNHVITRNCSQFEQVHLSIHYPDADSTAVPIPQRPAERRYPTRENRRPPERLNIEYQH